MQHDDLVGTNDGAELVGYDDDRLARDDLADGKAHPLLGSFYESCGCVEESSPLSSMAEMAVCVMNVVTQSSLLS